MECNTIQCGPKPKVNTGGACPKPVTVLVKFQQCRAYAKYGLIYSGVATPGLGQIIPAGSLPLSSFCPAYRIPHIGSKAQCFLLGCLRDALKRMAHYTMYSVSSYPEIMCERRTEKERLI